MLIYFCFCRFAGLVKIKKHQQVIIFGICLIEIFGPAFFLLNGFEYDFRLFRVVPETGFMGNFLFFFYLRKLGINVKGTSSGHQASLQHLSGFQCLSSGVYCLVVIQLMFVCNRGNLAHPGCWMLGAGC
jgi:hypothetical protein